MLQLLEKMLLSTYLIFSSSKSIYYSLSVCCDLLDALLLAAPDCGADDVPACLLLGEL